MSKIIQYLLFLIIGVSILLAAWPMFQGNLNFNTDIARDFLLLEDVYYNKNITLLGPRSGGIPGVFHGPLWIYLNLPAYILGGGNPTIVGWFWVLLYIAGIWFVYKAGKEIFDNTTGLLAATIFATATAGSVSAMFNPFGAVILFPIYFYYFYRYSQKLKLLDLVISFFILGLIIQFQMAFGVPILILSLVYAGWVIFKVKKLTHLIAPLILIIPLSSYIVFELRNNFLQITSALNYVSGKEDLGKVNMTFVDLLTHRLNYMINDTLGMISLNTLWLTFFIFFVIVFSMVKNFKLKKDNPYLLFILFLGGYWFLTLFYQGVIWGYYYVPFIGLIAIFFAAGHKNLEKLFLIISALILLSNVYATYKKVSKMHPEDGTWRFFRTAAEKIYAEAPTEFGYYVYSTDLYGYSSRYAMNYMSRKSTDKTGIPFVKKQHTYLLIDDPGDNHATNNRDWKEYDIRISQNPQEKISMKDSYWIEHYDLSEEELKIESNPNLIQTIIFR